MIKQKFRRLKEKIKFFIYKNFIKNGVVSAGNGVSINEAQKKVAKGGYILC